MSIDTSPFRVRQGRSVNLNKWPTRVPALDDSKPQYQSLLADHAAK